MYSNVVSPTPLAARLLYGYILMLTENHPLVQFTFEATCGTPALTAIDLPRSLREQRDTCAFIKYGTK